MDDNNMLDVGDWTIKLDACDPEKKTYAFYRPLYSAVEVTTRIDAMINCNFDPTLNFLTWTFDQDVFEEIDIYTDSINGEPFAARCRETVCGDRHDWRNGFMGWFDGPTLSANGFSQPVNAPHIEIKYRKGFLTTGRIDVWMKHFEAFPSNTGAYLFEFDQTNFYERCGSTHTRSAGTQVGTINSGDPRQTFLVYSGKRLRAGYGNVKVRARLNSPNLVFHSPWGWAEIVF